MVHGEPGAAGSAAEPVGRRSPDTATATQSRLLPSDDQVRPASLLLHHAPPLTTADSTLPLALEPTAAQLLRGGERWPGALGEAAGVPSVHHRAPCYSHDAPQASLRRAAEASTWRGALRGQLATQG